MDQAEKTSSPNLNLAGIFISAIALWKFLLIRWWIILFAFLVGGLSGVLYAYFQKPIYESHLTFALEDGEGALGGAFSLAAELGLSIGSSSNIFEGENILTLLTSRRIVENVLLSTDTVNGKVYTMADLYNIIRSDTNQATSKELSEKERRLAAVSFPAGMPREQFSYLQDSMLKVTYERMVKDGELKASKPDKKLNLYEVSVQSPNEQFSKVFTDKLIAEATKFYIDIKTKKSKRTLDVLEARVAQTKNSLNNAITSRATIEDANVNTALQQALAPLQKKQVDIAAYGEAYGELYKNLEIARYQYLKDVPLLQIIDDADYPMKKIKKGRLMTGIVFGFLFCILTISALLFLRLYQNIRNAGLI